MGSTDWGSIVNTGLGVAGGIYGQNQAEDDAERAQKEYYQDALGLADLQNEWNRSNMEWNRDQNREIANENMLRNIGTLKYNRPEMQSDYGSTKWLENDDGTFTQQNQIADNLQPALETLRGQYNEGIGNLDMGDFGVNNDVMNSIRELQAPGIQEAEDAQRARYAAMGIPIQSTAMDRGERSLSDARSRADLSAIQTGNQAWQQGQQNLRGNLGTMNNLETGWRQNAMTNPQFTELGTPLQGELGNVSAPSLGNIAQDSTNYGSIKGGETQNLWGNIGSAAGSVGQDIWNSF